MTTIDTTRRNELMRRYEGYGAELTETEMTELRVLEARRVDEENGDVL